MKLKVYHGIEKFDFEYGVVSVVIQEVISFLIASNYHVFFEKVFFNSINLSPINE